MMYFTMCTSCVIVQMEIVKFYMVENGSIIRFICVSLSTFYGDANMLPWSCVMFPLHVAKIKLIRCCFDCGS